MPELSHIWHGNECCHCCQHACHSVPQHIRHEVLQVENEEGKRTSGLSSKNGITTFQGDVGDIPQWDFDVERKRRIWKPSRKLFATDPSLHGEKKDVAKDHVPFPSERLEEMLQMLERGGLMLSNPRFFLAIRPSLLSG